MTADLTDLTDFADTPASLRRRADYAGAKSGEIGWSWGLLLALAALL
jgi:predicted amidohydrolase YtcJ